MGNEVTITVETGYFSYPQVVVVFDGTNIGRYFKDTYLYESIWDTVVDAKDDKDLFDFANFIFSAVNNSVKRHYRGQELMLFSVEAHDEYHQKSIVIKR
jgi:hypothetical protein